MATDSQGVPRGGQRRHVTAIMAGVVFAALLLAAGTYVWTLRNAARIDDRNLRELARIGREIEGRIENLHSVLGSLGNDTGGDAPSSADVARRGTLVAYLDTVLTHLDMARIRSDSVDTVPRCPVAQGARPPGTTICLSPGLGALDLAYPDTLSDIGPAIVTTQWPLEALRPSLGSEYFELTLVADTSGRVLVGAPDVAGIRVYDLDSLLDSLPEGGGDDDAPGAGGDDRSVTEIRRATIAGRRYRAFIQPIRISFARVDGRDVEAPQMWHVMGLVSAGRMTQERLSLGPGIVLMVGLVLAVVLLALPYVRTASMGPRERLRVRHLLSMVGSLILLSGALGIGLADLAHYMKLRRSLFDDVSTLADSLRAHVRWEIHDAIDQLDLWTRWLAASQLPPEEGPGARESASDRTSHLLRDSLPIDSVSVYPMLTMAFWVGDSGRQVAKWTPRSTNTSLVDVSERDYFRAIREGRGWSLDTASTRSYFLQSLRTWTTGEKSVAISTDASLVPAEGEASGRRVGVVLTKLASLDEPILPPGVSFALVDSTGHVLIHAIEDRSLEENLLEETGDQALRSTLAAHAEDDLNVTYRGRRTRLYVRPIGGSPLSLVVMLDRDQLETVHFESVFESAALFVSLCVLMGIWFGIVEAAVPRKMHWVWPDPEHAGKYVALAVVLGMLSFMLLLTVVFPVQFGHRLSYVWIPFQGLGLGLVALSNSRAHDQTMQRARWLGGGLALVATLGIVVGFVRGGNGSAGTVLYPLVLLPLLAGTAAAVVVLRWEYLIGRRSLEQRVETTGLQKRWAVFGDFFDRGGWLTPMFLGAMWLGAILLGVLPGYYLYQLSFRSNVHLLARHHQSVVVRSLAARGTRLDSIARDGHLPPGYVEAMDATGYDMLFGSLPLDLCRSAAGDSLCTGVDSAGMATTASPRAMSLLRRTSALGDVMPFVGETSLAMRALDRTQPDRTWHSAHDGRHVTLDWNSHRVTAALPVGNGAQASLEWWLALILGLTTLAWLLRWVSRRVFLVDVLVPRKDQLADVVGAIDGRRLDGNVVIVCTRSTNRSPVFDRRPSWQVIDLMDTSVETNGGPVLPVDEDAEVVCLDHADHRIREGEWGRALLAELERLVYVDRQRVVLLTSQEPSNILAFDKRDRKDDRYAERWTRLLGQFAKVAVPDGYDKSSAKFETGDMEKLLGKGPTDRIIATLRRECCRRPLHRIGRHIVDQILSTRPPKAMTRSEIVGRIRDEADSYYEALWAVLGDEERLVLAQLASGSVLSPSLSGAIARLHGRGILERGPELRLMNESFELFVRDKAPESVVREWELAGSASTWELIRPPLLVGWIVLALFLFWTQRALLGDTLAFLTAAGVGLATIGQLATHVRAAGGTSRGGSAS